MTMLKCDEIINGLKIGDKTTILCDIKSFTEYGGTNTGSNIARFKGKVCTVSCVDKSDDTFQIKEDEKGSWFSRQMTEEYYKQRKLVFNIDGIKGNDVCIHCEDINEVESFFNILKENGVKNGKSEDLNFETFIENNVGEEYFFELSLEGNLFYCNGSYFIENDYEIYKFENLLLPM